MKVALGLSVAINVGLVVTLYVLHVAHRAELACVVDTAVRGDERHLSVHARSLAALESGGAQPEDNLLEVLRTIVSAGKQNEDLRARFRSEAAGRAWKS